MLDLSFIDVVDLLKATGVRNVTVSGSECSFSCPGEKHAFADHNPSARMNIHTTAFICHGCGIRGNAIKFLSWHKKIPESKARRLLEERYGGAKLTPIEDLYTEVMRIMNEDDGEYENIGIRPDESWIKVFHVDWSLLDSGDGIFDYMRNRGFRRKILEKWQIGYDRITDRITIPIRNEHGTLVGFKGREWKPDSIYPKYLILGDSYTNQAYGFDPYHKSEYVFGLDKFAKANDKYPSDRMIIVEGELNVIALDQKGFPNAVGVAGSEFSKRQCELMYKHCESATIYFDNDESGWKGTRKLIEMLSPHIEVRAVLNAPGDAADLFPDQIRELLAAAEPALLLAVRGDL